jgi:hypothetical protein
MIPGLPLAHRDELTESSELAVSLSEIMGSSGIVCMELAEDAGRGSTGAAEGFRFHGSIGGFARSEASIAPLCDRSSRRFHPSRKCASASASLPCFTRTTIL